MLRIDTHTHVFRADLPMVPTRHYTPTEDALAEALRRNLDAAGLAGAVVVQPSFLGTDNSYLLDALRAHASWLRAVVVIGPEIEPETITAMHADGVRGLRFNLVGRDTRPPADEVWDAVFEQIRPLGWHVELHVDGPDLPPLISRFRRADLPVVVDHFGRPDPAAGVEDAGFQTMLSHAGDTGLFCKLSAPYRLSGADPRPYADALIETLGPGQLLWASDWPWTQNEGRFDYADCVAWGLDWIGHDRAIADAMNDAAARVFDFRPTTKAA